MASILRHGGEAKASRDAYAAMDPRDQHDMLEWLNSLVVFPPDDTASNLAPGDPSVKDFPQFGHGAIDLSVWFANPSDPE